MTKTLQFHKGQRLSIEGDQYQVTGGIEFHNRSDGSRWMEYCLASLSGKGTRWLSIDNHYEEYAIYTQHSYSSEFDEENLSRSGYREADSGTAAVISCFGSVDAEPGDQVRYIEYEDGTEELIVSVEVWEDETEYSRGCYLDREEIVLLDDGASEERFTGFHVNVKKLAVAAVVLAVLAIAAYSRMGAGRNAIHKYLEGSGDFSYQTSITSDLNDREKADVYTSVLTVEDAVKEIIRAIDGRTEDVQKSEEEDSVAILTKNEYCLVYTSTENRTMVQISSRSYAYRSTNTPYHASHRTHSYYRGFYYSRGYLSDRQRYGRSADGYENYSGDMVGSNPADPYRSYSDSIRQSSVNSRWSSGGGISSGK